MNNQSESASPASSAPEVSVAHSATVTRYPIPHPFEYQGKFYQGQIDLVENLGAPVTRIVGGQEVATGEYYFDIYEVLMLDGRPVQALKRVGGGIFNPHTSH